MFLQTFVSQLGNNHTDLARVVGKADLDAIRQINHYHFFYLLIM